MPNSLLTAHTLTLADKVGRALSAGRRMLASAESCTGGLVAGAVTAVAGSSGWFDRGFVTYSNEAKAAELGVDPAILEAHGAVSEPTARAMAIGAMKASGAGVAVSTTGIAGPGGATPGKPVGTVCFGWAWQTPAGIEVRTATQLFAGDRAAVRAAAVDAALQGLLELPLVARAAG
ncbi:CinA family protein [Pigmentiphaga soli]|uniref:CinA family protein n=1 Tax=Pigmentiphaga soli TaxID=1007095 RepID=A0ABP8GTK0_9BURK